MIEYPIVQPTIRGTYKLVEEYTVVHNGFTFRIPKDFETNGADIYRLFWSVIPPFKPNYLHAIIVHDYLCKYADTHIADEVFEYMLRMTENSWQVETMVWAVKTAHKFSLCERK